MLEVLLIMSVIYACMYMPLRGKTFDMLTVSQQKKVQKSYTTYMKSRKGKQNPNMKVDEYLPILQKQAMTYLIMAVVILPIYIAVVALLYSPMFFK